MVHNYTHFINDAKVSADDYKKTVAALQIVPVYGTERAKHYKNWLADPCRVTSCIVGSLTSSSSHVELYYHK